MIQNVLLFLDVDTRANLFVTDTNVQFFSW